MSEGRAAVAAYLDAQPPAQRAILQALLDLARSVAPHAEEKIAYGMPGFALNGALFYMAGWKGHVGFYPGSGEALAAFEDELAGLGVSKGAIRLPLDAAPPLDLIGRIMRRRVEENSRAPRRSRALRP